MGRVIAIDANYDEITQYVRQFRDRHVYTHPSFNGQWPQHELTRYVGHDAIPSKVIPALQSSDIVFVTASGHGKYEVYQGYKGVTLLARTAVDATVVGGKVIHLLACKVGALLGPTCIQYGAIAFWGYSTRFVFPTDDDDLAERFLHMDALIDQGILSGYSGREIYLVIADYFWKLHRYLMAIDDRSTAAMLMENFAHLVCPAVTWGDSEAVLS